VSASGGGPKQRDGNGNLCAAAKLGQQSKPRFGPSWRDQERAGAAGRSRRKLAKGTILTGKWSFCASVLSIARGAGHHQIICLSGAPQTMVRRLSTP
jgi:hypothetical protein